jgi:hypothetical protein
MLMPNGDAVLMQQAQLSSWSTGRVLVHDLPDQLSAESLADPLRDANQACSDLPLNRPRLSIQLRKPRPVHLEVRIKAHKLHRTCN